MSQPWTLTVFTDCGDTSGYDRLRRCKAVVDEVFSAITDTRVRYLLPDGCEPGSLVDKRAEIKHFNESGLQAIVHACKPGDGPILIDSNQLDETGQQVLRAAGYCLVQFTDGPLFDHFTASLVIDSSPAALSAQYVGEPDTVFLLGPVYFPLRNTVREVAPRDEQPDEAKHLLIAFGGSDTEDTAARVLQIAREDDFWTQITVILGPGYRGTLKEANTASDRVEILRDPADFAGNVRHADLAVCDAGLTAWDIAWLGVPMLQLVVSDDQLLNASTFSNSQAAVNLGKLDEFDADWIRQALAEVRTDKLLRTMLADNGKALFDGHGAERIAQEIAHLWLRWNNG